MKVRYRQNRLLIYICSLLLLPWPAIAQQADNENGTYTNPIIWSDFPDNDVIRVKDTYYMVATSMYFFPGVPVLKSKDLVNWAYAANAVQRFKQHPFYDLNGGNRYGHGQWASSLRYHNGKFYILFVTLDEGGMLLTADKAEGPWALHKLPKAYYDAGLFFDDDNKIYIVHGYSKLSLTEVDKGLNPISKDSVIFDKVQRRGLEGSHVYKINGYYYIYATYGGGDGYQVALRSKSIYGPYEEKVVLKDDMNLTGKGVHQGGLVQTQTGQWWSIIFQDRDGIGRVPTLQPVSWVNNWPMVGVNGKAVVTYQKPDVGKVWPVKVLPTSDEFNTTNLGMQWAWNHNPDDASWSLKARKGYLRLKTATVVSQWLQARNTLTQRPFGPYASGTAVFELNKMIDGDVAGLGVFHDPYAFIGVQMKNNNKAIVMVNNGTVVDSVNIGNRSKIYLKADINATTDRADFAYSFDNLHFKSMGDVLHMKFNLKMFTGNRFAMFNYATEKLGGYVDINWFRMDTRKGPPNLFKANSRIEAEMYDEIQNARTEICKDLPELKDQDITDIQNGSYLIFNQVDFDMGAKYFTARMASANPGGKIQLFIDDNPKPIAGSTIVSTGDWQKFTTISTPVARISGKHKLIIKFSGIEGHLCNLNWFSFNN